MIRPIHNEQSCWTADCHAHTRDEAVLGVLDVDLSLAAADRQIAFDQRRLILLAVLAIAASSLLLWWLSGRLIPRPGWAWCRGGCMPGCSVTGLSSITTKLQSWLDVMKP